METQENYNISLFKPTTEIARRNRNIIISLLTIWAVGVFGFQILLRVVEKPVAEPALVQFERVREQVLNGTAQTYEKQEFMSSLLFVGGKFLNANEREIVNSALTWVAYDILPDSLHSAFAHELTGLENERLRLRTLDALNYQEARRNYIAQMDQFLATYSTKFGLVYSPDVLNPDKPFDNLKIQLIPFYVKPEKIEEIAPETKDELQTIMSKYMIHNRSFLTDTKFLGFPFHYFYTAVFLKILFIFICWLYCVRIQALNKRLGIVD